MPVLLLLVVALMVWALVEAAQADKTQVRLLPKGAWVVVILLLSPVAAIVWFLFGRPVGAGAATQARTAPWFNRPSTQARPAPDDDPEFLARLKWEADRARRARERQDRERDQES